MTDMSMMKEKVKEEEEEEEESSTTDSLAKKTANEIFDRMRKGENASFLALLEGIVNAVMERDYFLQSTEDYANGFYTRKLQMAMGRLNLKVPRVRHSKGWRPALLPTRWGRVYRDYGQIVTAMMVNGYSQRQIRDSVNAGVRIPKNADQKFPTPNKIFPSSLSAAGETHMDWK